MIFICGAFTYSVRIICNSKTKTHNTFTVIRGHVKDFVNCENLSCWHTHSQLRLNKGTLCFLVLAFIQRTGDTRRQYTIVKEALALVPVWWSLNPNSWGDLKQLYFWTSFSFLWNKKDDEIPLGLKIIYVCVGVCMC